MNGLERILSRIDGDTQSQLDRVNAEAQEKADAITAQYRAQSEREAAELDARSRRAAAEREERLVSVAQMEARKVLLAARQQMVDQAFDRALSKLCALPDGEYVETVAQLLLQAAPDGRGQVIFAPETRERIGAAAVARANELLGEKGKLTLSPETRPMRGGFLLSNGSVEVNGTFETLVRLRRGELAGEVARELFPGT